MKNVMTTVMEAMKANGKEMFVFGGNLEEWNALFKYVQEHQEQEQEETPITGRLIKDMIQKQKEKANNCEPCGKCKKPRHKKVYLVHLEEKDVEKEFSNFEDAYNYMLENVIDYDYDEDDFTEEFPYDEVEDELEWNRYYSFGCGDYIEINKK